MLSLKSWSCKVSNKCKFWLFPSFKTSTAFFLVNTLGSSNYQMCHRYSIKRTWSKSANYTMEFLLAFTYLLILKKICIRKWNVDLLLYIWQDYLDAFEKLLRMGLKSNQQQEIVIVIITCCLQEKKYNPFYAYISQKLCEHHRTYQVVCLMWHNVKG